MDTLDTLTDDMYEKIAAYALGSLDLKDMVEVEQLLASSPAAREELHDLREVVGYLPYAAPAAEPPLRVRRQILARIAASREPQDPPPARSLGNARWRGGFAIPAVLATLATLVLLLGGLTLSLRSTVNQLARANRELGASLSLIQSSLAEAQVAQQELTAQLASDRDALEAVNGQLVALNDQLSQDQYVLTFVTAPGVATRQLAATGGVTDVRGEMYMYPGQRDAVVLFHGLPALKPGQVYQFWLADEQTQVASGIIERGDSGLARLLVEAPREVNAFSQVMVTVEQGGGSTVPSTEVVLEGSL